MRAIVLSKNHRTYCLWLNVHNKSPREFAYVDRAEQLEGLRGVEVIKLGGWMFNKGWDFVEAVHRLEDMNRRLKEAAK